MAESLFLNKYRVDIYEGQLTREIQIADIGDIATRKSSYSYTLKMPKTSRNKQFFEMLGVAGNSSRKPFEEIIADYVVDGIYLVTNGLAIIRETGDNYNLNLIDGIRSLGDLLGEKKISSLPMEDLNHIISTQNYVDSFANTEGYIYGIANYGQGVSSTVKVEKQAPSIFVHTIFRRIFESNGLTLQGEFFTTNEKYLSEVLTPSKGFTISDVSLTSTAKGGVGSNTLSHYETTNEYKTITTPFTLTNNSLVGASIVAGEIVFSVAGTYRIDLNVAYSVYKTYGSVQFLINGSNKSSIYLYDDKSSASRSIVFTVSAGDTVSIVLSANPYWDYYNDYNGQEGQTYYTINYSASVSGSLYLLTGGQLVKPTDYIGDITQMNFIKDIINRYGLLLHPIQSTNEFKFKRIEALLQDRLTAEDWTEKLVSFDSESYVSGYAKTNKFNFKYPEATVIPTKNGEMIVDNYNADNEKTMYSSPFEIPVTSGSVGGIATYLIPIWNATPENLETPLKIMNVELKDVSITAKLFTEVTGITVSNDVPFLNIKFIDMQYFINVFYRSFNSIIDNFKKVGMMINLSVIDIYNIDFFRLKYLKQTGRFYYLLGIQNRFGKASKVEAIEILEFPENQPPSQLKNFTFNMQRLATRQITLANLTNGYEDPELDEPLKVKISSGFNDNVLLKQNGVTITSLIEINVEDLNLTAVEVLGGVDDYQEAWWFQIADKGSGTYGTKSAQIIANVLEYTNYPPVADAGDDYTQTLTPKQAYYPAPSYASLNGSGSYDNTGEIVQYTWSIISKPNTSSVGTISNSTSKITSLKINNDDENVGEWVVRLTVKDEFGATDTDEITITTEFGDWGIPS